MSAENLKPQAIDGDVKMVDASDTVVSEKSVRDIQTQHGDYRTVDEENTFVFEKLLLLEAPMSQRQPTDDFDEDEATTSAALIVYPEQGVWFEGSDEVSRGSFFA